VRNLILLSIVVLLYGCNQESKPIITGEPDLIEVDWYLQGLSQRYETGEFCFLPMDVMDWKYQFDYSERPYKRKTRQEGTSINPSQSIFNVSLPKGKLIIDSVGRVFLSDLLCGQPDSGLVVLWEKIELDLKDNYVILSNKNQKIKQPLITTGAPKEFELIYQTKSNNH
jgi:hypothetical protein